MAIVECIGEKGKSLSEVVVCVMEKGVVSSVHNAKYRVSQLIKPFITRTMYSNWDMRACLIKCPYYGVRGRI